MNFLFAWKRINLLSWRGRRPKAHFYAAALAVLILLVAAFAWTSVVRRQVAVPAAAAAQSLEHLRLLSADQERAMAALFAVHEALLRALTRGQADSALLRPLAEFNEAVDAMSRRLADASVPPSGRVAVDTFTMLRNLSRLFQSLDDDVRASRPVSPGVVARCSDGMAQLLRYGRALHEREVQELRLREAQFDMLGRRAEWVAWLAVMTLACGAAAAWQAVQFRRALSHAQRAVNDSSQRALAAEELAATADRGKSKFLGMLSHELLTPLQSIVSSMDIIESKGRVEASDPVFMRLREGARSLQARMSDLVDFAKMSAGRLTVNPRKFRIDRLIEEVIADHEEALVRKDLDIHWDAGPVTGLPVHTDPRRVRQILDNLVSNAIKYTARGGITLEAELIDAGTRLRLDIRDTGIGIAPDLQERIFEPFFRIPSSSQLAEGSGLGLAVVHSLIDLLHGRMEVESTVGEGTRFTVEIPLGTVSPAALPMPAVSPNGEVLIVDDAHDARAVVAANVRELGYRSAEAGSAGEALRMLGERKYTAVLLDIELPDRSGFDVIRLVREGTGPNQNTFFVMLSASHEAHEAASLFNVRAEKPIQSRQLQAVLQQAS